MAEERQFCTFYLDNHCFGIDVLEVQEVFRYQEMTRVPLASNVVSGLINLRGQIITAINLRLCLGIPSHSEDKLPMNVVVHILDDVVSLLVDDIGDVIEVNDEIYEAAPDTLQANLREIVRGVYKLPGNLMLVLDTHKVVGIETQLA